MSHVLHFLLAAAMATALVGVLLVLDDRPNVRIRVGVGGRARLLGCHHVRRHAYQHGHHVHAHRHQHAHAYGHHHAHRTHSGTYKLAWKRRCASHGVEAMGERFVADRVSLAIVV